MRISDWSSDVCSSDLVECEARIAGDMDTQQFALHLGQFQAEPLAVGGLARAGDDIVTVVLTLHLLALFVLVRLFDRIDVELLVKARLAVMADHDLSDRPRLLLLGDDRRVLINRKSNRLNSSH